MRGFLGLGPSPRTLPEAQKLVLLALSAKHLQWTHVDEVSDPTWGANGALRLAIHTAHRLEDSYATLDVCDKRGQCESPPMLAVMGEPLDMLKLATQVVHLPGRKERAALEGCLELPIADEAASSRSKSPIVMSGVAFARFGSLSTRSNVCAQSCQHMVKLIGGRAKVSAKPSSSLDEDDSTMILRERALRSLGTVAP
eukprot:scaffold165812_cov31-Tisochrysis_lutea.AAC.2